MKKPTSLTQLLGVVFMMIGPTFIGAGYLNRMDILPTAPNSQGDPATAFPILGSVFLVLGVIFFFAPLYKEKKRKKLKIIGQKVQGTVTKIRKLPYTKWGNQSPYIVCFSYEDDGDRYEGKSPLIWDGFIVSEGDTITVYVDEYKKHHYFIEA